ncbi:MAG: sn-glycerol-3-phosphate ABC transporter ATP-binding protein UgpC [Acholeplasma sp.]|nr:sn-glycerol-3-phosphate ABC transporter ATP-binding protein UgpC [Acholeplasma sp.]
MATMALKNVNKIYPNGVQAVFDFNIDIKDGEFIVLVGPSGCGKSTTLRMIAGLEDISTGELIIDNNVVNQMAPKDRDIAMVFQNYALYAHMTVYHNMAFSLTLRKEDSDHIHERVMWAANILGLVPYLNRKPRELSGGQRQRVALGRAIVRDPKVFLLDEPLSNLDAKLRGVMRKELKELHHRLGATMIYVTHDQIEALTLADRVVVMKDGYVQQIDRPADLYQRPNNLFVANFIGTPPMNVFGGEINEKGELLIDNLVIDISAHPSYSALKSKGYFGKKLTIGIRPENFVVSMKCEKEQKNGFQTTVQLYELLGSDALVHVLISDKNVIMKINARQVFHPGDEVVVNVDQSHLYFFDLETEICIYE